MSIKEAAYILNVSSKTVRRWSYEGKLRVAQFRPLRIPTLVINSILNNVDWCKGDSIK